MFLHSLLILSSNFLSFEFFHWSLHKLIPSLFAKILFVCISFLIVILFNTLHELCILLSNYVPLIFLFSLLLFHENLLVVSIFTGISFVGVMFSWPFKNNLLISKFRFVFLSGPKINVFLSLFTKWSLGNVSCELFRCIEFDLFLHFILAKWWIGVFN